MKTADLIAKHIVGALTAGLLWNGSAVAESYPPFVQREIAKIIETCRSAGGKPANVAAGVARTSLRNQTSEDWVIFTTQMHCAGAQTVWGGTAGQTLVLIPGGGSGIRQLPAHSWRVDLSSRPIIEVEGGFDCAMGRKDRCTTRLQWNGHEFATLREAPSLTAPASTSSSPQSIVGDWGERPSACGSALAGMIRIGPKSITTDEMSCTFSSVSRSGSTVNFAGTCSEGNGPKPVRISTTESDRRLTVSFGPGRSWKPLMRCN